MGLSPSKPRHQPYPAYGPGFVPTIGHGYVQAFPQQPFIPGYGPLPPPQLSWPTQQKQRRRTSRKHTSSSRVYPPGFHPSSSMHAQPPIPQPTTVHPSLPTRHAEIPSERTTARRAQTPFQPMRSAEPVDDLRSRPPPQSGLGIRTADSRDSEESYPQPEVRQPRFDQGQHRNQPQNPQALYEPQRQPNIAPRDPDVARVLEPLEPANPSAFGPSGPRPRTPIRNPLPIPPRDLYELSPYKSLLNLPQTTALLTATYAQPQDRAHDDPKRDRKKQRKGLFRAFSSRKHEDKELKEPAVRFVPVFVQGGQHAGGQRTSSTPQPPATATAAAAARPNSPAAPRPHTPPGPSMSPIRYDQASDHAGFLNHSPHRVLYDNKIYHSATHLLEAIRYLPDREDLAERIRSCQDISDVYPLSASFQKYQRSDWSQVFLDVMEKVLYLKFTQHPDLRSQLLDTFDAALIYADPHDSFWGEGPQKQGTNQHGKVLERVRKRLQDERRI